MRMTNRRPARLPKARRFAAVRMDPVAMVEHLQDPAATHAAKRMQPKEYLVYLEFPEDLPMPESPWCRYRASPIAITLRPAHPEKGITSDMVVPIYPNTDHSKGNIHISSTPPFPFPNCYFWIESRMSLRVRVSRGLGRGYDNDKAYQLSIPQHLALANSFEYALDSISFHQQKFARTETNTRSTSQNTFRSAFDAHSSHDDFAVTDDDCDSYPVSDRPLSPSLPPSITDLFALNLFGWDDDPTFQFIPLVDLRFEVEETFTSDTIPSPAELWKEQETISRIIKESLRRRESSHNIGLWNRLSTLPDVELRTERPALFPAGSSSTLQHSVWYMEHVQFSDRVEHRTWSGGIHVQENISISTFGEELRPFQDSAARETTIHSFNAGPEAEPVPELLNDPSNEPPPPQYTRKAAPHTPPPSYADVIKNGRTSLPRPGSRAAVWPSRHDSSPVPQRSESSSTPNADDPARKRHAHRRATKPRAPDRPPPAPRLHSYTYLRESESTVRSEEGWLRIRTDIRLPVVERSVGTRRVVADQQRRTTRVLQEERCAAAQSPAQRQQGAQQGEPAPAPRPRTAYNAARRKYGSAARQVQRGRSDSGPVDRTEAPHAEVEDVPVLVHSSRSRSLPLLK